MKQLILVCDINDDHCQGDVVSWRLWAEGDRTAKAVDLCAVHSLPIQALVVSADEVELPVKPRAVMHVTKLKATDATRHLKKK